MGSMQLNKMDSDLRQVLQANNNIDKKTIQKEKEEILKSYNGSDKMVKAKYIYEKLKEKGFDDSRFGVKTGFRILDNILTNKFKHANGIMSEDLCIITGHTGNGKSTLVSTLRRNLLKQGFYSALFSLENSIESIVRTWRPNDPNMSDYIDFYCPEETVDISGEWLKDRMIESVLKYPHIKVMFIDHLDYIYDVERGQTEEQAIRAIVKWLTIFAKRYHVIIFLVAHPSNKVDETAEVQLHHIKGSSSVKQYAAQVLVINTDEDDNTTLKLKKNRWAGSKESVNLKYIPEIDMYTESGKYRQSQPNKINFRRDDI